MNIVEFLRDSNSKYFLVPITAAILGVVAKWACSNDKIGIRRPIELFYLAPNLLTANFIMIICEFSRYLSVEADKQQQFLDLCFSALMFNIGATVLVTMWIRSWGWNIAAKNLKSWTGIIIPDILAGVVMYFVFKIMSV